jgi:hypothetical protein
VRSLPDWRRARAGRPDPRTGASGRFFDTVFRVDRDVVRMVTESPEQTVPGMLIIAQSEERGKHLEGVERKLRLV